MMIGRVLMSAFVALSFAAASLGEKVELSVPGVSAADLVPVERVSTPEHDPIVVVEEGRAVVPVYFADAPQNGNTNDASRELFRVVELTTGAKLERKRGEPKDGEPGIVLGTSRAALDAGISLENLEPGGYEIKTAPHRVYIVGHEANGLAWGIVDFMERVIGARWYFPDEHGGTSVIERSTLSVPPLHYRDAPVYRMRDDWPHVSRHPMLRGTSIGRVKTMGRSGSTWPVQIAVHQPSRWHRVYRDTRPEIFQLRADGGRNWGMLSYGHPKTLETFIENIAYFYDELGGEKPKRKTEEAYRVSFIKSDAITVSPGDQQIGDEYEASKKLMEPEKGAHGSASRLMARFVSKLAQRVKERWPDKTIIYLAYLNYTLAPDAEDVDFPGNVEVQLCGMPGLALYKEPKVWEEYQGNIDRWRELSGRKVQTWEYSCWPADRTSAYYQYPHTLKEYYQHNRDKIVGSFINGTLNTDESVRHHITLYAWLRIMWNPDVDVDAILDEYARRMYGSASDEVREILQLACDRWQNVEWGSEGRAVLPEDVYDKSFTPEVVAHMRELLAAAQEKTADDELLSQRMAFFAHPFDAFFTEAKMIHSGEGARPLVARKIADKPVVDGKLDEPWWDSLPVSTFMKNDGPASQVEPRYDTELRVGWTLDGLAFGFTLEEPNLDALITNKHGADEGALWFEDNVEIFFKTTGTSDGPLYQYIVSATPTLFDSKDMNSAWDTPGIEYDVSRGDGRWFVEVWIPYDGLRDEGFVRPATGVSWIGQFTRHRISDHKTNPDSIREHTRLNDPFGGFSRNLANFAEIRFVE